MVFLQDYTKPKRSQSEAEQGNQLCHNHLHIYPCKNSQAVKLVWFLKAWVKKVVKSKLAANKWLCGHFWLPPLISQLFSPRLLKFYSLAVYTWISFHFA